MRLTAKSLSISLLAFCMLCHTGVNAQLLFKDVDSLPVGIAFHSYTCDAKYAYAAYGLHMPDTSYLFSMNIYRYDPGANKWTAFAAGLSPKNQSVAEYIPATGKIYIMGGVDGSGTSPAEKFFSGMETVDVHTGKINKLAITNPVLSAYGGSAVWENKLYYFGGTLPGNTASSSLYVFDPQKNSFTKLPDMPAPASVNGEIVDGVLYTFGGFDAGTKATSDKIWAYTIATKTWKEIGKLPKEISSAGVAKHGSIIYVAGSYDDLNFIGSFNTKTQKFIQLTSNMTGRRHAGVAVIDDRLYLFGGNQKSKSRGLVSTQVADLKTVEK